MDHDSKVVCDGFFARNMLAYAMPQFRGRKLALKWLLRAFKAFAYNTYRTKSKINAKSCLYPMVVILVILKNKMTFMKRKLKNIKMLVNENKSQIEKNVEEALTLMMQAIKYLVMK